MKVGIVGLGSIARKHMDVLREIIPDVLFIALRHCSQINEEGVLNVYSYNDLIKESPNFIIISNPTSEHFCAVKSLAQTGIPLFIEKPLFSQIQTPPDVKGKTYIACNLRFLDCLNYIKRELQSKRINEVNVYCGSYLPSWREGVNWRSCYSANKDMGGGVHIDLIHEIDYLYWLFGKPEFVQKYFRSKSSLNITSFDYAHYIMDYGTYSVSVVLNYYRHDYKRTLEVLTDKHTYLVDLYQNIVCRDGEEIFRSNQTYRDTYRLQMQSFLSGDDKFNDINEALEVLKICLD